jgi:hypothetical protein
MKFKARRILRSETITVQAKPDDVFSLLCPVRESEWLDGWDYTLIYSESGYAEKGCVFISRSPGEQDTIWLITKRDPLARTITFSRVTPGSRVTELHIQVQGLARDSCRVTVSYEVTAITDEGNRYIAALSVERFRKSMAFWEKSLNYYVRTGQKLQAEADP